MLREGPFSMIFTDKGLIPCYRLYILSGGVKDEIINNNFFHDFICFDEFHYIVQCERR